MTRAPDAAAPRFGDAPRAPDTTTERPPRAAEPADRPARRPDRGFRPEPAAARGPAAPPEREFWEVWSEEKAAANEQSRSSASVTTEFDAPAAPEETRPREGFKGGFGAPAAPRPRDTASEGDPSSVARLYLNVGRKDGAGEQEILDLLTTHAGVSAVLEMDVMNTHTYINVAPDEADRVCTALSGKEVAGRELVCERAKPRRR